jgi:murein DD-endopeptidase MepM/ murein hydrolase activator NlpD
MNSPFCGKFRVSQQYKPGTHDGLDLVGIDSKEVHATISGTVHYAGWENPGNHAQGFGQYVCIRGTDGLFYYYGHLSQIKVKTGQTVTCTDVIGIEGSTGHSTGPHCHYEIRGAFYKGAKVYDVCSKSGIPNVEGGTYDDGYRPGNAPAKLSPNNKADVKKLQNALNAHGYNCGSADGIIGVKTTAAMFSALADLWLK